MSSLSCTRADMCVCVCVRARTRAYLCVYGFFNSWTKQHRLFWKRASLHFAIRSSSSFTALTDQRYERLASWVIKEATECDSWQLSDSLHPETYKRSPRLPYQGKLSFRIMFVCARKQDFLKISRMKTVRFGSSIYKVKANTPIN